MNENTAPQSSAARVITKRLMGVFQIIIPFRHMWNISLYILFGEAAVHVLFWFL